MLSVTHRPIAERLLSEWRMDLTNFVNKLEQRLDCLCPTIKLSDNASALAAWLSKNSERGRSESRGFEEITVAFPGASKVELEDACGELQLEGLVMNTVAVGHRIRAVEPQSLLFEIFDPIVFQQSNPRIDAAKLSDYILKSTDSVSADTILTDFGWTVRRFNPAMSIVCRFIGPGRKSAENHPEFVCRHVSPNPSERVALRRFIAETVGAKD